MPPAQPAGGATMGPVHKQPAVNEPLLVALFSHWSAPQWVPPTSNQLVSELTLAVLLCHWSAPQWFPPRSNQLLVSNCLWSCSATGRWAGPRPRATVNQGQLVTTDSALSSVWCSGPQVESEVRGRSQPSPGIRPVDKLGSLGNKLGALSCRTPEPFPWPPLALA